jgi:hypothetical protein
MCTHVLDILELSALLSWIINNFEQPAADNSGFYSGKLFLWNHYRQITLTDTGFPILATTVPIFSYIAIFFV